MSAWVKIPGYPKLVRRSTRFLNKEPVDYRPFFFDRVKGEKRCMKVMQRSSRTFTITAPSPDMERNGQAEAGRNTSEEPLGGLKRGRSNEGNGQRRRNKKKRHDQEAGRTEEDAGKNGVNAPAISLPYMVQFRVEEGDANIMASAAASVQTSPANSICGRRNNRRFPMTPRPRPDSFSSDDMSEDHDEQNIFRDAVEVTSSNDARLRQFLVRTTHNIEPSDGTSQPDHNAAVPPQGAGVGSQNQQVLPQSPPPYPYPWQLGPATLGPYAVQGFRGNVAPMNVYSSPLPCDSPYYFGRPQANSDSLINNIQLLLSGRSPPGTHGNSGRDPNDILNSINRMLEHYWSPHSNAVAAHQNGHGNVPEHQQPQQMGFSNDNGASAAVHNNNTEANHPNAENIAPKSRNTSGERRH